MVRMNYQDRIVRDPQIVGGEPVLKGTRVTLKTVASLAEGATTAEILADFPTLSEEDVRAAIAFAAGSAQEDMPLIETPIKRIKLDENLPDSRSVHALRLRYSVRQTSWCPNRSRSLDIATTQCSIFHGSRSISGRDRQIRVDSLLRPGTDESGWESPRARM
jgi:uncharacterized protein (DUF433 family)